MVLQSLEMGQAVKHTSYAARSTASTLDLRTILRRLQTASITVASFTVTKANLLPRVVIPVQLLKTMLGMRIPRKAVSSRLRRYLRRKPIS